MQEKKSLVQEALIQMKNVEQAIAENAKGILASTMKEEINQLVKESLSEQDEEDDEINLDVDTPAGDIDVDTDNEDDMDIDVDADTDLDDTELDADTDLDMDSDDSPIDLTDASDEEILKVFKAMGENDGIIVKKDGSSVHLKDENADVEYLVKLGESTEDQNLEEDMDLDDQGSDVDTQKVIDSIFSNKPSSKFESTEEEDDEDDVVYEISLDEDDEELDEQDEEMDEQDEEMDEQDEEMDEQDEEMDEDDSDLYEAKKSKKSTIKPKGVGIGSGPKFDYKKTTGGFKEDKKEGPKKMGTGKAKFEFKKGPNAEGKSKIVKKVETKEAAHTFGFGSKEGRGLRKGITPNRNMKYESLESEVKMLREKNEEYRKALNTFREKLTEVAIFNSNLAYATRLFTEHSTTKKEKINILRRFDDVETLKESKSLYKSLKEELSKTETKSINETVDRKLNKTASTGSSTTLIESKTYEAPQFARIKDLMSKLG